MDQVISISTVAYDGHDLATVLREVSELGTGYVELAYIQGYVEAFSESFFSDSNAGMICELLSDTGLLCLAFSAHMDLTTKQSVDRFRRRMDFANRVGADIIISNVGPRTGQDQFMRNIEQLAEFARSRGLVIALENPGDGIANIIDSGKVGASIIKQIGSEAVRLNYDFGNVVSHHHEKTRPEDDFLYALPFSAHFHIKDVTSSEQGWSFPEIGRGSIDYASILRTLASQPQPRPLSLEIPLRVRRAPDASPRRSASPAPLDEIRKVLRGSLDYVRSVIRTRFSSKT
jgi:sugar phosphate isomerase/epimerase